MNPSSIGIDVGKKELVTCVRGSNGRTEPPVSFPNSSIGLNHFLRYLAGQRISSDVPILLESTGPYHWQAAHLLTTNHYLAKVVNPLHTRQILRHSIRKRKTDKVDAGHLAFLASQGYGYPFSETVEMARRKALVRHYWKLRNTATTHLIHERYLKEHRAIAQFTISSLIIRKCAALKEEIITAFRKGNDLTYLDSIPGVSPLLAATILAELAPRERFTHVEQVVAYAGLDPQVKQSGSHQASYGKLSKRGSSTLRHVLFLAAFGSFLRTPFHTLYHRYKVRGVHHTAILCILSRKILRISFALLKKREKFTEQYLDRT